MGSCKKCGKKQLYPIIGQPSGGTGGTSEPTAHIQMRYTVTINLCGVPTNLYVASVQRLPYSVIITLINHDKDSMFFKYLSEKTLFLLAHPEFGSLV